MHEIQFADAVRPARAIVLQLLLLPYSIGHELLLFQQRNPFKVQAGPLDLPGQAQALIQAVNICSMTWAENHFTPRTWREKRRSKKVWAKWERAIKRGVRIAECGFGETIWDGEIEKFTGYLKAGAAAPPVQEPEGAGGRDMGAPFHASLLQFVIAKMGVKPDAAYDYPLALAKFHYYTAAEASGAVNIINAHQSEFAEYCRNEDARAELTAKNTKNSKPEMTGVLAADEH
jgi:hypothetical protein